MWCKGGIPAYAGMTWVGAGMTCGNGGCGDDVMRREWVERRGAKGALVGPGHDVMGPGHDVGGCTARGDMRV